MPTALRATFNKNHGKSTRLVLVTTSENRHTMLSASYSCPRCRCNALYRTHRKGLDWLMSAIGMRPVRCYTCSKRFYIRWSPANNGDNALELRDEVRTRMTAYPD